jgi:hypothetical protein
MSQVTLVKKLLAQEVEEFPEKLDVMERLEGVKTVEDLRRRTRFRPLLSIISGLWHAIIHCAVLRQAISTERRKGAGDVILTKLEEAGEISKVFFRFVSSSATLYNYSFPSNILSRISHRPM